MYKRQAGDGEAAVPARLEDVLGNPAAADEHLGGGKAEKLMCDIYRTLVTSEPACHAYRLLLSTLADRTAARCSSTARPARTAPAGRPP